MNKFTRFVVAAAIATIPVVTLATPAHAMRAICHTPGAACTRTP